MNAEPAGLRQRDQAVQIVPLGSDTGAWDAFVTRAAGGTFCHLVGWRSVMTGALGHECRYVVALDSEGAWQGVLPLVRVKSPWFGDFLVSLPFLNYGGPVGTPAAQEQLSRFALAEARRLRVSLLELRNRNPVPPALEIRHRKLTVLLDLPSSAEALWQRFPSKLRSQIRRAEKAGLVARFGPDQAEPFYDVFARTMRELGTPVMPRSWFDRIAREFPRLVQFGVVYRGAEPVAAGCGFLWRGEYEMTWAGSLRSCNHLAPNMLLYWSFMEATIAARADVFNFGRCTPDSGTHRFKRQWGGRDYPLPWGQWSSRHLEATPSPERPAYRLAAAVWRRLPLRVTRSLGPALARVIP